MTNAPYRMPKAEQRVNDFIVGVLFSSVLIIAGVISISQFSFY